jgi:regulator of sigma D
MPNRHSDPGDQFLAVEKLLTEWLKERRALLSRYTEMIVALDAQFEPAQLAPRQKALCELLVDYISAGHFEIFNELINEAEVFGDDSTVLTAKLLPAISDTTEVILAYDEKYSGNGESSVKLKRDLSALGEMLESRFVLEDRLIAGLHNSHRRSLATT